MALYTGKERLEIRVYVCDKFGAKFEIDDFSGNTLQSMYDTLGNYAAPEIIYISNEFENGVKFYTKRMETDEEYETRMKPYTAKLIANEEKERKEYERLKAKYGDK